MLKMNPAFKFVNHITILRKLDQKKMKQKVEKCILVIFGCNSRVLPILATAKEYVSV